MNHKILTLSTILLAIAVVVLFGLQLSSSHTTDVKVVDLIRLFNHYQLKADMERADSVMLGQKLRAIDSVKTLASVQQQENYQQYLYQLNVAYEQAHVQSNDRINEAVWKQLNTLIDKYGQEQGVEILIGANGMGSVMYHDAYHDITDELIKYVNDDYSKK